MMRRPPRSTPFPTRRSSDLRSTWPKFPTGRKGWRRPRSRFASGRSASTSTRSEEHTSELQSRGHLVCRLLLEKKKKNKQKNKITTKKQQNTTTNKQTIQS